MAQFMSEDFLLTTEAAKVLYHTYAEVMPVIDYHCHINPQEIYENRRFENLTQVWLGGDHYKWRLMRSAGVEEKYITGDAPDREKFQKWAEVIGKAIGNPVHHWSHLELKRFFGYDGALNARSAEEVWALANEKLKEMPVREMILKSNVTCIATTDDPVDSLEWHRLIREDESFPVAVLPAWRPDKAMDIEKADYLGYLERLEAASGMEVRSFAQLKAAILNRMDFFESMGCRLSDHGLSYVPFEVASEEEIERIFLERLSGKVPGAVEAMKVRTAFMLFMGKEYAKRDWAMQLHYGARRNNNTVMFGKLGPDTGFDTIDNYAPVGPLAEFLNAVEMDGGLPRTVIYSLNPADDAVIDALIGCFQGEGLAGKVQHGSAWWFNDHIDGMTKQIKSLGNMGYLAGFVGMLTDSRSFLSYPRHEYFRRILCGIFGEWVEKGMFPEDYDTLGEIVQDISYNNAKNYFGF